MPGILKEMGLSFIETAKLALQKTPVHKHCYLWVKPLTCETVENFSLIPPLRNKDNHWACVGKLWGPAKVTEELIVELADRICFVVENHVSFYATLED